MANEILNSLSRIDGELNISNIFAFCFNIATFLATILLLALLYDINKQNKTKQGVKND